MCHQEAAVQRTFQLERSSLSSSLMVRTRQSSSLLVLCTQLFLASYPGYSPTKSMSMRLSYTAHRLQLSTSRSEKTLYDLVQECIRTEWKLSSWHMSHYCQGFRRRGGWGIYPAFTYETFICITIATEIVFICFCKSPQCYSFQIRVNGRVSRELQFQRVFQSSNLIG